MPKTLVLLLLLCSCARLTEQVTLRAQPLEPPRIVRVQLGERMGVTGAREGNAVRAHVTRLQRCADVQEQRAEGFRHVVRQPDGKSLVLEWVFGSLFAAGGAGLIAWTAASPVDLTTSADNAPGNYAYGAAIAALGVGLLAGAIYDQSLVGTHEESLGERTLRKEGPELVCGQAVATGGQVRLTLADGTQLESPVDGAGEARIELPADLEKRLEREGSRRATLEVMGDVRAQIRLDL